MSQGTSFTQECLSDTGCSRTIIAKDILVNHGIPFGENSLGERLQGVNKQDINVNGVVFIKGKYVDSKGKVRSRYMNCLVTDELSNEIIVSWHDAASLGAVVMDGSPGPISTCAAVYSPQLNAQQLQDITTTLCRAHKCLSDEMSDEPMVGPPMIINLDPIVHDKKVKDEIFAKKAKTHVPVPIHYKQMSKELIDDLLAKGIIRKIAESKSSQFCSRAFVVPKPCGKKVRLVIDNSQINKYILRPVHPFTASTQLLQQIPASSTCFAKLDALWGYYQIALDEDSKHLTTFIHESGTFQFNRAPMGLNASGDEFCKRTDEILEGAEGVLKLVDDILVCGDDYDQLLQRVKEVLRRCDEANVTLSKKKFEIGEQVTFCGFDVSRHGHKPTKERTDAIEKFPTPTNVTGVRSFLGLANGLAHFVPDYAQVCDPLYHLLKKQTVWRWGEPQNDAFLKVKSILTGNLILRNFDPALKTRVVTDASRIGTGFCLLQLNPKDGRWHLVQCGSKSLNGPESRYAVCELEGLGILHALRKCRHYLVGMKHFEVITDHKSLRGVFRKSLHAVENVRLRRYREKLGEFNFTVTWVEGKLNTVADALSRFPAFPADPPENEAGDSVCKCNAINPPNEARDPLLQELIDAANADQEYQTIKDGLATTTRLRRNQATTPVEMREEELPEDHPLHKYAQVWKNLSIHPTGLIILNHERIVVPASYRNTLLNELHSPHCGQTKTQRRARRDYWWPNFDQQIQAAVRRCSTCVPFLPSQQQQPVINQNNSRYPMQVIGADEFQIGSNHYLAMVDQFSGFPWVERLPSSKATTVIKGLKHIFDMFGNPEWLITDNGRNFTAKQTGDFLEERKIQRSLSSPYYPQSNGLSEACVKNVKALLAKCNEDWDAFNTALLQWRDTPNDSGMSPSKMFLGRRVRSTLPTLPDAFVLKPMEAQKGGDTKKEKRKAGYAKLPAKTYPDLAINQRVVIQDRTVKSLDWNLYGNILQVNPKDRSRPEGRSYLVELDSGLVRSANRVQIKPVYEEIGVPDDVTPDVEAVAQTENDLDVLSNHESDDEESDPEEDQVENNPESPAASDSVTQPAATRRSTRSRKAKSCQLCVDCRAIRCSKIISTCCHATQTPEETENGKQSSNPEDRSQPTISTGPS